MPTSTGSTVEPGSPPKLTVRLSAVAAARTEQRDEQDLVYDAKRGRPERPKGGADWRRSAVPRSF